MTVTLRVGATGGVPGMVLRPWEDGYAAALIDAYRDPVLRRWTRMPVRDHADAARWLAVRHEGWARQDYVSFVVEEERGGGGRELVANVASCRVAGNVGYELHAVLPVRPPFPAPGHLHVRRRVVPEAARKGAVVGG